MLDAHFTRFVAIFVLLTIPFSQFFGQSPNPHSAAPYEKPGQGADDARPAVDPTVTIVDFHEFAQPSSTGVAVGNFYASRGVVFENAWGSGYWDSSGASTPGIAYTDATIPYDQQTGTDTPITGHFVRPGTNENGTVSSFSVRSIFADSQQNRTVTSVSIYDLNGALIETRSVSTYPNPSVGAADFAFTAPNIHRFVVAFSNPVIDDVIGIDQITFTASSGEISFDPTLPSTVQPSVRRRNSSSGAYNLTPRIQPIQKKITVRDSNGLLPNVPVKLTIAGDNAPAGHASGHSPLSVHGWLAKPGENAVDDSGIAINAATSVEQGDRGGSARPSGSIREEFTATTDNNGEILFVYIPPEVGGTDKLEAKVSDRPEIQPATASIKVIEADLIDLSTISDFTFVLYGATSQHPANAFGSSSTIAALRTATAQYTADQDSDTEIQAAITRLTELGYDFPNDGPAGNAGNILPRTAEPLYINDISLEFGGLFDVDNDFASPHGGHRSGNQVDIDSNHLAIGSPYSIARGQATAAGIATAYGDTRLEQARAPFRNTDSYQSGPKRRTNYSDAIRQEMLQKVRLIHNQRLQHLIKALRDAGGTFVPELDHIHVNFQ